MELYKNETICLKQFNDRVAAKYEKENDYLESQVATYVGQVKAYDDRLVEMTAQLTRFQTAYEEQQLQTMACFKYLHRIKTKYEDEIEKQGILIQMLNERVKLYFKSDGSDGAGLKPKDLCSEPLILPENWDLQEKIEYLELKFINEKRDKLLNRLLFENEQLRKLLENDFIQNSQSQKKKRIKTHEDFYMEYLNKDW